MKKVETSLSDRAAALLEGGLDDEQFLESLARLSSIQEFSERRTEAGLRKWMAISLWIAATLVLGVSILLVIGQAFEISRLPDNAVTALVVSVAAEFVGMFYVVVRYLFPHGRGKEFPVRIE